MKETNKINFIETACLELTLKELEDLKDVIQHVYDQLEPGDQEWEAVNNIYNKIDQAIEGLLN